MGVGRNTNTPKHIRVRKTNFALKIHNAIPTFEQHAPAHTRAHIHYHLAPKQDAEKLSFVRFPFPYAQCLGFMHVTNAVVTPVMSGVLIQNWYWAVLFTFLSVGPTTRYI